MNRVFIVDDHAVVRAGIASLLSGEDDIEVVGQAADAETAVAAAAALDLDVVLMDLQLGDGVDGVEATRRIRALPDPPQVLVLTTYDSDADITRAIDAGAMGYLLKAGPPDELFRGVHAAARGESVLSPQVASRMMRRMRDPMPALSPREVEILQLLAEGAGNREIGKRLFITEATVKTHLQRIYAKLGVESRTAAVTTAVERHLIRIR